MNNAGNTNVETIEKMETIAKMIESRGFTRHASRYIGFMSDITMNFYRDCDQERLVFVGCFLNVFSKNKPIQLWHSEFAREYKYIEVKPVFRRNGTSENVSIKITVEGHHSDSVEYTEFEGIPYCDVKYSTEWFDAGKITKNAGVRAITKRIDSAIDAYDKILLRDNSRFAKNPEDYHPDTEKEYREWQKSNNNH